MPPQPTPAQTTTNLTARFIRELQSDGVETVLNAPAPVLQQLCDGSISTFAQLFDAEPTLKELSAVDFRDLFYGLSVFAEDLTDATQKLLFLISHSDLKAFVNEDYLSTVPFRLLRAQQLETLHALFIEPPSWFRMQLFRGCFDRVIKFRLSGGQVEQSLDEEDLQLLKQCSVYFSGLEIDSMFAATHRLSQLPLETLQHLRNCLENIDEFLQTVDSLRAAMIPENQWPALLTNTAVRKTCKLGLPLTDALCHSFSGFTAISKATRL